MILVNAGSGDFPVLDAINLDMHPDLEAFPEYRFIKCDIARGLPFLTNSVDYVMAHHFMEHLPYPVGHEFMLEVHRVLRPGGTVSLVTPDFDEFIEQYRCQGTQALRTFMFMLYPPEYNPFPEQNHMCVYTGQMLKEQAYGAGFIDAKITPLANIPYITSHVWWQVGVLAYKGV